LQKLAIGAGEIPSIGRQSIEQLSLPIYNMVLGVNPLLITFALSFVRFWDAIVNPIAGSLSDNTQSRFGRRKPFLFVAAIVCALTLPFVWMAPAGWSENAYFAYFFVTLLIYFTAYAFFDVPLMALALEATPDYHERTRVAAYKSLFVHSMGILSMWLFALTQLSQFDGSLQGARFVGLAMGGVILVFGVLPALVVREGHRGVGLGRKGLPFFQGVKATLTNKPFLQLCVIALGKSLPLNIVSSLGLYIVVYHVYSGDMKAAAILTGLAGTAYQLSTIAAIPVVTWMSTRLGKVRAMRICLLTLLVGSASSWFTYNPQIPHLIVLTAVLLGPGQTAFYTLIRSMLADVCDSDELTTGLRREGMYGSMQAWLDKAVGSIATILSGLTLVIVGFDQAKGGQQSVDTITWMRVAFTALPVLGVLASIAMLASYPLTTERAREIRRELEARRGPSLGPTKAR